MGSYTTLIRQCAIFAVLVVVVAILAPWETKPWIAGMGATALIFFIIVSLMRHYQMVRLAQEVSDVLHGSRRLDFSDYREGDIAILANELGKMVSRLQRTSDQLAIERNALSNALADISHQIRTPLTAIGLMLPSIERADNDLERKRLVRELESMIDRVSWLVAALMKIAKADAGALQTTSNPVNAAAMARHAFAPLEMSYDIHGVELIWNVDDDAVFIGDEIWTAEAIENILKNCLEHTPTGGAVTITIAEDALATTVVIRDTGPGILKEDLPHIFERFYRGRKAEGESDSDQAQLGFGIGLALAQALISIQGGSVRAANDPRGGARFTVSFPKCIV